ncbi:EfeM/EfeO family lipoprotein [Jatrophihabitans sp.]|uniref:EfeM/EfeO family lipoprotein n=1 Tax=Jatrophihabitans sp. TaxID=1932789 RepID=UPI0030C703A9
MVSVRLLSLAVGVALVATACGSSSPHSSAAPRTVQVSVSSCGVGWSTHAAGAQHLLLSDTDSRPGGVALINPSTGAVFAEVEPIGPGTTADLDITLGAGTYALRCAMEDEAAVVGPRVTLTGSAADPAPGVVPVDQADLIGATKSYEAYVSGALPGLTAEVAGLRGDIMAGDEAKAKTDWLTAHLSYERLGAAYDAFGDLDGEINGLTNGLPGGVHDSGFTGFHRIEYGLWHGEKAATLVPQVDALNAAVGKLAAVFAKAQIDPLDIAIRAHEISENALQFELTGEDDYGSHSELATVGANLDGTKTVLAMVSTLLKPRDKNLPAVEAGLARAQQVVGAHLHTALGQLTTSQREQINAAISQLCELLAPVATILEPRRTS